MPALQHQLVAGELGVGGGFLGGAEVELRQAHRRASRNGEAAFCHGKPERTLSPGCRAPRCRLPGSVRCARTCGPLGGVSVTCRLPSASRQRYSELARSAWALATCAACARSRSRRGISLVNHHQAATPSAMATTSMAQLPHRDVSLRRQLLPLPPPRLRTGRLDRRLGRVDLVGALFGGQVGIGLAVAIAVAADRALRCQQRQVGARGVACTRLADSPGFVAALGRGARARI